jgi:hypothetical protein
MPLRALELLQHLLEANSMSASDLALLFGCPWDFARDDLRGERNLTPPRGEILARHFAVLADLLPQ